MQNKIVFGGDPEFFAGKFTDNGPSVVPPVFFREELELPVEKNGRHPIFLRTDNGTVVHEDGAAFEFSLLPSTDWRDLFDRISDARKEFSNKILSKFSDIVEPELLAVPTINWDVIKWANQGPTFKMATAFGCDPDRDVFGTEKNPGVFDASTHDKRYGGGHIHVSGVEAVQDRPLIAVKCLVLTAGLASIAYSDVPELEQARTFRYGQPGKFRIQKYRKLFNDIPFTDIGIEYRTISNRWTHLPQLAEKLFTWAEIGINNLLVGGLFKDISEDLINNAVVAIQTSDQKLAMDVLSIVESKI